MRAVAESPSDHAFAFAGAGRGEGSAGHVRRGAFAQPVQRLLRGGFHAVGDHRAAGALHQRQHFGVDDVDAALAFPVDLQPFAQDALADGLDALDVDSEEVVVDDD